MQYYDLVDKYEHPTKDLAIVTLSDSTGLWGYNYTYNGQTNDEVYLVGFGISGDGLPQPVLYPRGVGRVGVNTLDSVSYSILTYDFDDGDVTIAVGDSGGATFLKVDESLELIGIHYAMSEYREYGYDIRIGAVIDWIDYYNTSPIFILGDANRDGIVSAGDYASVQTHYGETGEPDTGILGDANLDGVVSAGDYGSVQRYWTTPEPGDLMIYLVCSILLFSIRTNNFFVCR